MLTVAMCGFLPRAGRMLALPLAHSGYAARGARMRPTGELSEDVTWLCRAEGAACPDTQWGETAHEGSRRLKYEGAAYASEGFYVGDLC